MYKWLPCTIVTGVSVAIVVISDRASNINQTAVTIDTETAFGKSGNRLGRTFESLPDLFAASSTFKSRNVVERISGWRRFSGPTTPIGDEVLYGFLIYAGLFHAEQTGTIERYSSSLRRINR